MMLEVIKNGIIRLLSRLLNADYGKSTNIKQVRTIPFE